MRTLSAWDRRRRVALLLILRRRRRPDAETTIAELRERFGTDKEEDR